MSIPEGITEALTLTHPTGQAHMASPPHVQPHPMGTSHQLQQYQRGTTLSFMSGATPQRQRTTFVTQVANWRNLSDMKRYRDDKLLLTA